MPCLLSKVGILENFEAAPSQHSHEPYTLQTTTGYTAPGESTAGPAGIYIYTYIYIYVQEVQAGPCQVAPVARGGGGEEGWGKVEDDIYLFEMYSWSHSHVAF